MSEITEKGVQRTEKFVQAALEGNQKKPLGREQDEGFVVLPEYAFVHVCWYKTYVIVDLCYLQSVDHLARKGHMYGIWMWCGVLQKLLREVSVGEELCNL